jgi:lipid II:glycine glycyltransferase (peptidoglycan interpeptide bridge formation enzyme)
MHTNNSSHPLQSKEWGEFRKVWGNDVIRLSFGQVIFSKIPFTIFSIGTFIKGPKPDIKQLQDLKELGKKKNSLFIKIESNYVPRNSERKRLAQLLRNYGCVPGKTLFTPTTFWIDLTKSEDDLLKSFSSKTRYNIRIAQRHGVTVVEDNSDKAFDKYIDLTRETVQRQGFYAHTEKYHSLMWKYLHQDPISHNSQPTARLLTARYKDEIITAWIVFVWKDFLYYPYGASSEKYKNVMANNLMMWEAIKYGQRLGLKKFDLWGREEGKGFTKFKEGYNPEVVEFLGTWDLVTSPFYQPYKLAEQIRWNFLRLRSKLVPPEF